MLIKLKEKFADNDLDKVIHDIFQNYKTKPQDKYYFDLTQVEFIGNQELLVLSALFKSFVNSHIEFEVEFFKKGIPTTHIEKRVKRQIIQFWEVWKIWQVVPNDSYFKYFGIDGNSVERLQLELNYFPKVSELYTRHGVTPFVSLDFISNYKETEIQKRINPIYRLNDVVEGLLKINNCSHPFTSKSLSTIITEELYLNFLDHSIEPSFKGLVQLAFMSISFQGKLEFKITPSGERAALSEEEIQRQKAWIFETESLPEAKGFFYDSEKKQYKNQPYIQFSFLDFGQGIPNTLRSTFSHRQQEKNTDSDILRFAFNHDSSRHPIFHEKNKIEQFIPRGLFDALTIVRRYRGLLVVRSNFGKILFDFSKTSDVNKAFSYFGNPDLYFPGTLLSLYIPAIEDNNKLNVSAIKPEVEFAKVKPTNEKYVSINLIAEDLNVDKEILYNTLLKKLKQEICSGTEHSLVFVSFKGCELPKRVIKKTIYFLLSDYDINHKNNVVILHSPSENIISEIATEILMLNDAIKNYKLHPLPIIDFNKENDDVIITWLGIYNDEDKEKLKTLLYDQYSLAKSDFKDPSNLSGHLSEFDSYGNFISNFPSKSKLAFYRNEADIFISKQIEGYLNKHDCIKKDDGKSLYLCNGNYYQREYIELNNLINDKNDCTSVTNILFENISAKAKDIESYKFVGVTTSSHKILKTLKELNDNINYISLDNYHDIENELNNEDIKQGEKYILICDVFSTGFLTKRLQTKLNELGASIEFIGVVVSILDSTQPSLIDFSREFSEKLIFLHERKIQKFKRKDISSEVINKTIIRVNPHTNIPIRLSIKTTNYKESIIFPSQISTVSETNDIIIRNEFLDRIEPKSIHVGFLKFNNVIHPYFFDTDTILKSLDRNILTQTFKEINRHEELKNEKNIKVFYPRKSGIESFNFQDLNNTIKNDSVEYIEIERFGTPEGWRFPHNTDYLSSKIKNNLCFILDDGSCSGDSLIQMIDEISFYEAKEIILICFIGRVNDHKREFFSRLSKIKVAKDNHISVSIFFVCHWHIPTYYLDENPNIRETTWLNGLIDIQNTPPNIKEIARTIINSIKPQKREYFEDYKHLPKIKDTGEIPKKDLLLVREELGKVIGYRLYEESFKFFDCLIKKYEKRASKKDNHKDRYKEIELLCGCFVYEPYLYEKIEGILPDVVEKIEEFVDVLIFKHSEIKDHLSYQWDKKDIIHLFFIVFKNEKLLGKLNKRENFIALAQFTKPKESGVDYILYKLLHYFPILNTDINKHSTGIKKLLLDVSDLEQLSTAAKTKIKIYRWFISSLPSSNTFPDFQSKLKTNYERIVDQKYHDDNIFNDKQIIKSVLLDIGNKIRKGESYENEIISIKSRWENIASFIEDLLSFSSSFHRFFIDEKLYSEIETKESSLRKVYGELTEIIYNEDFNRPEIGKKLDEIFAKFILEESQPLKIFSKPNSTTVISSINTFIQKINDHYSNSLVTTDLEKATTIDFPQFFLDTVLKELFSNFRHINSEHPLKIVIGITPNKFLKIKIWNSLNSEDFVKGGNNGMKILKNLNNQYHKAYYKRYSRKLNHLQIIKFKTL